MSNLERFRRGQGVHQPGFAAQLNDIIDAVESLSEDVVGLESGKATTTHTHDGLFSGAWGSITGTLSAQTDLNSALSGKSDTSHNHSGTYAPTSHAHSGSDVTSGTVDAARLPVGTGATHVAAGDHTHTGVYAGSSHAHAGSDITSGTVDTARLSTGTGATDVALGNHAHSGVYATAAHSHSKITPNLAIGDDGEPTKGQLTIADNAGNVTVLTCLDGTTSLGVNGVAASLSGHTHSYAPTSHAHAGSDITSGTVGITYLPAGTGATDVAYGNHNHSGVYANASHAHAGTDITSGVVGKTYGGAGDVTGILKANGSGTVSAASAGTDFAGVSNNNNFIAKQGIGVTPTYGLHIAPTTGLTAGSTVYIQDATATTGKTGVIIKTGAGQADGDVIFDVQGSGGSIAKVNKQGGLILNESGESAAGAGMVTAYAKVASDSVATVYDATLDRSGGSGGAGLGLKYKFSLEQSAGSRTEAGNFQYVWTTPTAGAEVSKFTVQTKQAGSVADALAITGANSVFAGTVQATSFSGTGTSLTALNGTNITSGVVGKTYGGAGDVTGILKANGSGTVSAAGSTDYIAPTLVDAKGDIIVASGADAVARVAVGADGLVVSADSAATNGVSYKLPNRMDMEVQEMSARIATGSSPLLAWTFPLVSYGYGSFSATDGQLVAVKCWIPETITATGMVIMQGDTTLTNPDNYNGLALFSSAGTLIAKTADQGTAWGSGTNQFKAAAFDDGTHQITGGPGVYVYLAVLTNSNGGTQPKFLTIVNPSSAQINAGYTAGSTSATVFHGNKTGQTAMPTAANGLFTLSVGGYPWWMGLY